MAATSWCSTWHETLRPWQSEHATRCRISAAFALSAGVSCLLDLCLMVLPLYTDLPSWALPSGDVFPSLSTKSIIEEGSGVPPYAEFVLEAGNALEPVPVGADRDDPGAGTFSWPPE